MAGEKETFMQRFFVNSGMSITWFDLSGVMQIDDNRAAVIGLVSRGTRDRYEGIGVSIVDKYTGEIVGKRFWFVDYLVRAKHQAHINAKSWMNLHVGLYQGNIDWYIIVPESTKPLVDAVKKWIAQFK